MYRVGREEPRYEHVVVPARAGMYRSCASGAEPLLDRCSPHARGLVPARRAPTKAAMQRPRTRGDVTTSCIGLVAAVECSPHARGCTGTRPQVRPPRARSVPRTRGDVPRALVAMTPNVACPRRAGMYRALFCVPHRVHIVFPARAGMYRAGHARRLDARVVPRTRGDVTAAVDVSRASHPWFPLRAGMYRLPAARCPVRRDVFPARAGRAA